MMTEDSGNKANHGYNIAHRPRKVEEIFFAKRPLMAA